MLFLSCLKEEILSLPFVGFIAKNSIALEIKASLINYSVAYAIWKGLFWQGRTKNLKMVYSSRDAAFNLKNVEIDCFFSKNLIIYTILFICYRDLKNLHVSLDVPFSVSVLCSKSYCVRQGFTISVKSTKIMNEPRCSLMLACFVISIWNKLFDILWFAK